MKQLWQSVSNFKVSLLALIGKQVLHVTNCLMAFVRQSLMVGVVRRAEQAEWALEG